MLTKLILSLAAASLATASAEIYFQEDFNDADWSSRWVQSSWKPAEEIGAFEQVNPRDMPEARAGDKAIKTSEDARFYGLSAKFPKGKTLNNLDKDLYVSYLVQHEKKMDCGGSYIKLLPSSVDQETFGGETDYSIMFGPDICGSTKTHAILTYQKPNEEPENLETKSQIKCESDTDAHVYSLVIGKDNTYDVRIDGESVKSGELAKGWDFQPPKEINDPEVSKPEDWVDDKEIPDPEDVKPAGYDDIPKSIPDPEAVKPEDWDEEDDGEWEPPMIDNPEYKGEWKPKMIANPEYKGEWVHPMIPNPAYFEDDKMHNVAKNVGAVGFELWQVTSGTVFDDILVTDDKDAFTKHEERVVEKTKEMKAKHEEELEKQKAAEEKEEDKEDKEDEEENDDEEKADEKDEL